MRDASEYLSECRSILERLLASYYFQDVDSSTKDMLFSLDRIANTFFRVAEIAGLTTPLGQKYEFEHVHMHHAIYCAMKRKDTIDLGRLDYEVV